MSKNPNRASHDPRAELSPAQRAIRSQAELGTYNTAIEVVNRVALLAANLENHEMAVLKAMADGCEHPSRLATQVYVFDSAAARIKRFTEESSQNLLYSPMTTGMHGISLMQSTLHFYPQHAVILFDGYTAVDDNPAWSEQFCDASINGFGKKDEQLILFALEQGEAYDCQTYEELAQAAQAAGRIEY